MACRQRHFTLIVIGLNRSHENRWSEHELIVYRVGIGINGPIYARRADLRHAMEAIFIERDIYTGNQAHAQFEESPHGGRPCVYRAGYD